MKSPTQTDPTHESHSEVPSAIRWAKRAAIAQIALSILVLAFLIFAIEFAGDTEFWVAFEQGFTQYGYGRLDYEMVGFIGGSLAIASAISVAVLVAIDQRNKNWAYGSMIALTVLVILGAIGSSIPLLHAIMLGLMLTKSSRDYLGVGESSS